ncbi:hypothetical protein FB451DRAFT_1187431 [Mycena latifolia]|nr:hypothetical protein FB451DRAFT_1187431 [Mycena latifolia]
MACSNCRRQKLKCRPQDGTPNAPCERCNLRSFTCEYVSVTEQQEELIFGGDMAPAETASEARRGHLTPPPPGYTLTPPHRRQPLPDLSLMTTPNLHASQVPCYHDSSPAGWAGSWPEPSPGALFPTHSRHYENPTPVQPLAGDHGPVHNPPSCASSPAQTPGVHHAAHHPAAFPTAQIFDLVSKPIPKAA